MHLPGAVPRCTFCWALRLADASALLPLMPAYLCCHRMTWMTARSAPRAPQTLDSRWVCGPLRSRENPLRISGASGCGSQKVGVAHSTALCTTHSTEGQKKGSKRPHWAQQDDIPCGPVHPHMAAAVHCRCDGDVYAILLGRRRGGVASTS